MSFVKKLSCLAPALCALVLCGCSSDGPDSVQAGKGTLLLRVGIDGSVTDVVPASRASQATAVPDASELNLKLSKADGSYAESWGSPADFPVDMEFPVGAYTLEAYYGAPDYEGFDSPYYYGAANVQVTEGAASEVQVTASLANTMVSIDYTDAFRSYFTAYSTQIHAEGGDFISFKSDETRPAYTRPGKTTVTISVTKQNGLSASIEAADFEALARHHYHVTLDVNDGQTGQGEITVLFDDSIVTEDVTIDISDQALMTPAPTVTASGFTPGQAVSADEGSPLSQALMTVNAPAGLRSAVLTTQSASLIAQGFPAEIDLMSATEAQQALLASFGLDVKGLYRRPDKMAVIDFSNVIEHISGAGDHSFTLVVKDKLSKVNAPVTLAVKTRAVNTSIVSLPDIRIDATTATMTVSYDGSGFADKAGIQVQDNGVWNNVSITNIAPAADNKYVLTFNVPADYADFPVRLNISGRVKATGILHKTGVILSANAVDVWATHATFSVHKNKTTALSDITYYVSADGTNFTQAAATANADGTVTLTGLTPGRNLTVKASDTGALSGAYRTCAITTETAAQPQNANMDTWGKDAGWSKAAGLYNNTIYNYWPGSAENAYWATRNALTTCKDFGSTSMWYNYYSGTYNAAGMNGTNCAEICTVGWARSQANTFITSGGHCDEKSAGYLFMGSYSFNHATNTETFNYGRPFTSRPTALSFMYKFKSVYSESLKANESFKAYIVIENRDGGKVTELGRGELVSNQDKDAFTQARVNINYTNRKLKATHAYVVFVSSTADSPATEPVKGSKGAFQGYTDARYIGNVLNVDNIEFIY